MARNDFSTNNEQLIPGPGVGRVWWGAVHRAPQGHSVHMPQAWHWPSPTWRRMPASDWAISRAGPGPCPPPVHSAQTQAAAILRARLVDPEGLPALFFVLKISFQMSVKALARQLGWLESSPYARCGSIPCQGPYGKQPMNAYVEQQNQCFSKTNQ